MNDENKETGVWLTLQEYSAYKKVSLSTIRRYIKAKNVKYKMEAGKYYLYHSSKEKILKNENNDIQNLKLKNILLEKEVKRLNEVKLELEMLLNIYEQKIKNKNGHEKQLQS